VKKLAILVSSGTHNNLVQVATLIMAAVLSDIAVRVLFRDESACSVTTQRIHSLPISEYFTNGDAYRKRLREAKMDDVLTLLREAKEDGDVRLYACTSSMFLAEVSKEDLIPEIDEARGLVSFMIEEMETADQILTF